MKHSDNLTKIAPALLAAQRDMTAAAKSATNPHFKSRYSDLATIIEAVKAPLNAQGIAFMQSATNDATGVMVETRLQHESGEYMEQTIYLPVPQQTPQAYGSAITYAKRYQLQSMVGLPSEDDDGEKASEPAERKPITGKQIAVDAFDELPEPQQKALQNMAATIIDLHQNKEPLVPYVLAHIAGDDQETRLALWSLLPSDTRTAFKKEQELRRKNGDAA
jgi:hypothetical protein